MQALAGLGFLGLTFPAQAAIELVIDPLDGGSLGLRSTLAGGESVGGYSVFSAGGYLAGLGDPTLGGQFSFIKFDVDNVGSDEVVGWTFFSSPVPVGTDTAGLALDLAWTGPAGVDPQDDLIFRFGADGLELGGNPVPSLPGVVVVLDGFLSGDYSADGSVEQADLDLVLGNWGRDTTGGIPAGWVNTQDLNGVVDQAELDLVLGNWGSSAGPAQGPNPVPEPGSMALLAGLAILSARVRHRPVKS